MTKNTLTHPHTLLIQLILYVFEERSDRVPLVQLIFALSGV